MKQVRQEVDWSKEIDRYMLPTRLVVRFVSQVPCNFFWLMFSPARACVKCCPLRLGVLIFLLSRLHLAILLVDLISRSSFFAFPAQTLSLTQFQCKALYIYARGLAGVNRLWNAFYKSLVRHQINRVRGFLVCDMCVSALRSRNPVSVSVLNI